MASNQPKAAKAKPEQPLVIVTGVSGSIGAAVARALAADYHVVGLDREGIDPNAEDCFEFDLTSDESMAEAFDDIRNRYGKDIASVVHLAAYFAAPWRVRASSSPGCC
ncbi:MAG: NAD-dependent epimerase/dehydratase family protein [Gammaproteobacteria bacterium]|nr:NAD-dependent epimerase/dehydratase family protein [Gammaproteobacteria bacterium]